MPSSITIKKLHATTGKFVRAAGKSRLPLLITDRGQAVAVLASPSLLKPRHRKRTLLPEYEVLMAGKPGNDMLDDLNKVRGDR
jgi:hypothetical protein